jgi:transcriptional antiterminator NusG
MKSQWYAIAVAPNREAKVSQNIINRFKKRGISTENFELVSPEQEVVVQGKDGEKSRKSKLQLPGYLLVYTSNLKPEMVTEISRVAGVLGWLGNDETPTVMDAKDVEKMLGSSTEVVAGTAASFTIGDSIKVIDGPMTDFEAVILDISDDSLTLTVELEIFGKPTKTQVAASQVKRL